MQLDLNLLASDLVNKLDVLNSVDVIIQIELKSCLESIVYYLDLLKKNKDNVKLRQIIFKSATKLTTDLERHLQLQHWE